MLLAVPAWRSRAVKLPVDPQLFNGLRYRSIGPARGGRVTALAGVRKQPHTFYLGATGGGVWKTTDAGGSWANVSDGFFATGSIGALAVAESDANIVYAGTGSAAIRSNVILGKGVYKSADAGKTWTHVGLREVGQIGAIEVDPRDANVAFVAALGQPFGANAERGVFKTTDGGKTWRKVLFINDRTGVVALALNPASPHELYAGAWQAVRKPWTIVSGGPAAECGIYKSTDGGETWTHLSKGLPPGLIGKVGVSLSASNPQRVYAVLEASEGAGGVYRSDDAGASWTLINKQAGLIARPFYYTYIDADPKNADVVYVNNLGFYKSTDGGKSFRPMPTPHGDNQGMWINPDNPEIFIQSNDGGANVTLNGGRSWSSIYNQPTAEIYQVALDNQFPYLVYGAQQDNTTLIVPSLPPTMDRPDDPIQLWKTGPGCETGPIMPSPLNPQIVYGVCKGEFYRTNFATGQTASYWVHPQNRYGHNPKDILYRFQRVSPMEISPFNPRVLYHCSHVVHRSLDEGVTWQVISPDLTANEPDKQVISGEPITRDITGEEVYSTIYAFRESTLEPGVLWAGANDGPVSVSRDNGKTWKRVTPKDLPPGGRVQNIEPSPHRKGAAYIAVYRYLLNDWQPYIYATNDYGATWTRLTDGKNGIPNDYPTRVVREDPDRAGLLYAGTEFGMFVSFDNGQQWQPFQLNLPVTPVTDIRVQRKDLVLSTMGRAFWILDNVTPLHQLGETVATQLLQPRMAYRTRYAGGAGRSAAAPEYPPPGAQLDYVLAEAPAGELKLEVLNALGKVVRTVSSNAAVPAQTERPVPTSGDEEMRGPGFGGFAARPLTKRMGLNRYVWDLRVDGGGPLVVPGKFTLRLSAEGWSKMQALTVELDPRLAKDGVTLLDLREQFNLLVNVRDTLSDARKTVQKLDTSLRENKDAALTAQLQALRARLVTAGGTYPQPMLIDQLSSLSRMAGAADRKVGRSAIQYFGVLKRQLTEIKTELAKLAPDQ
ncbi:MAG: hypothetical protein HYR56_30660 [Acidobacteria bacterium]|nr:hypothetical protein [Acidobacteriota bacterium]MBI3423546.1 hypothetical protein [Acidobacteriota bacterium]